MGHINENEVCFRLYLLCKKANFSNHLSIFQSFFFLRYRNIRKEEFSAAMDRIFPSAFPYVESANLDTQLAKLIITDATDIKRYVINLSERLCTNIQLMETKTGSPCQDLLRFAANPHNLSPLLLSISPAFCRLKLHLSVSANTARLANSLVILKSWGSDTNADELQLFLELRDYGRSPSRNVSKISFSKLVLDDQQVIVNDSYGLSDSPGSVMNVFVCEESLVGVLHLFSFLLFVENTSGSFSSEAKPTAPTARQNSFSKQPETQPPKLPRRPRESHTETSKLTLPKLQKAFTFDVEDGPEFRQTLQRYEHTIPRLNRTICLLSDEAKHMESTLKKLLASRSKISEFIRQLEENLFNSLLKDLGLSEKVSKRLSSVFESTKTNMAFLTQEILNVSSLAKMHSYCLPVTPHEGSELSLKRRAFEKSSKEYYDWLNKYLSNEKERPELKLLLKRKTFELAKFDYLNTLNLSSNNQYFNEFIEHLLKFSNLSWHQHHLDLALYHDNKESQTLLNNDMRLYFFGISRFNSEKQQFRQMIEACETNEELAELIKTNPLNSKRINSVSESTDAPILDNVFPKSMALTPFLSNDGLNTNSHDQNGEISGILYALGGQGKPGWHKEWVVLKEGQLNSYSDWRKGRHPITRPIDVALASVKPMNYDKRRYCFEIITSRGQKHVFQAMSNIERNQWMKALYNAGQITLQLIKPNVRVKTDLPAPPQIISPEDKERQGSPVSVVSSNLLNLEVNYLDIVRSSEGSENDKCADCGATDCVEWVSLNLMVVVCLKCSSCHRNMGSHVSKVRSLKLDNFLKESLVLLSYINNLRVNSFLEYAAKGNKVSNDSSDDERLAYIKAKYVHRAFMKPVANVNLQLASAVRKIDINGVIEALDCGADPNIRLQLGTVSSEQDPVVVLLFEYSLRKLVEIKEHEQTMKFFVISELLLLHGCNIEQIDRLHEELNLPKEAWKYWEEKKARLEGK